GRPDASGGSQAIAMLWPHCSALNVTGAPGRAMSWKHSGSVQHWRVSQWRRQHRTVARVVPRRRAPSGAVSPSANRSMICAPENSGAVAFCGHGAGWAALDGPPPRVARQGAWDQALAEATPRFERVSPLYMEVLSLVGGRWSQHRVSEGIATNA